MMIIWRVVGCVLLVASAIIPAHAQINDSKQEQSALVDGLLDLLDDPNDSQNKQPSPPPNQRSADAGSQAENLGEQSDNPLVVVRQSMLIAADHLRKGNANTETRQLQSGIVQRLDELIAELEKSENSQTSTTSSQVQQRQSQTSQTQQQPQSSPASQAPAGGTSDPGQQPEQQHSSAGASPDTPGQQAAAANAVVDLADPQALQQSVWGQLPEQVRKQLQSRMVEQFLPSYREQIEAYFQALLESQ